MSPTLLIVTNELIPTVQRISGFALGIASASCLLGLALAESPTRLPDKPTTQHTGEIDFANDVRPILSDHCFACHGPDAADRQADLRLDTEDGLLSVVERGDPNGSEMVSRIHESDADVVMPPPEFHKPLSAKQKQVLEAWIQSGAVYQRHWAFEPPRRVDVPENDGSTDIDRFLLRQIQRLGLTPNQPAGRPELLRRICLDLTGLPPTATIRDEFLDDDSPDAVAHLVDRLMNLPAFGEHFGRHWLDLVRYADTHGLHLDNYREMWPYRDWVIEAFNSNMPFDQFITEQLAGDLVPGATRLQKVASGFNRLNVTTNEGGSIYDEVFTRNVIDRTDAFGTIFLGLTTGCAVCHDHKFDPISQHDYYSLSAFFNSLDGRAMDGNVKDHAPAIKLPSALQQQQERKLSEELADVQAAMDGPLASVDQAQRRWQQQLIHQSAAGAALGHESTLRPTSVVSKAEVELSIRDDGSVELGQYVPDRDTQTFDFSLPPGHVWQTIQLEVLAPKPGERVGASSNGNAVLSEIKVQISDSADGSSNPSSWKTLSIIAANARYEQSGGKYAVTYAFDGKQADDEGWAVGGHEKKGGRFASFLVPELAEMQDAKSPRRLRIQLAYQSKFSGHLFRRVRFAVSEQALRIPTEQQVQVGPIHAAGPFPLENFNAGYGRPIASRGSKFDADQVFRYRKRDYRWHHRGDIRQVATTQLPLVPNRNSVTVLHQSLTCPASRTIQLLLGCDDGHNVYLNGKKIGQVKGPRPHLPLEHEYSLPLKAGENRLYVSVINHEGPSELTYAYRSPAVAVPPEIVDLVSAEATDRNGADSKSLQKYFRKAHCYAPQWTALVGRDQSLRRERAKLQDTYPTTLIWKETDQPRDAFILNRGQYDQPGEKVMRATPSFLSQFPEDAPADRLGLAMWLTDAAHPLTARVAVNRFWQILFGTGLVKTSEDFGSQGSPPSHPELLDHLAMDFQQNEWDVKRLIKRMVMTDAYRRSAAASAEMLRLDPENRWLARGPRFRLDAEVLRDQSLALSGLLNPQRGGPSVKPPQPEGLWEAVGYTNSDTARFKADTGPAVRRRSVYIFWKRTSAPPQMATFDAPTRESCTARRERTNTPLQALLMLNEVQFVEAAKALAKQTQQVEIAGGVDGPSKAMRWLIRHVTARDPKPAEVAELTGLRNDLQLHYDSAPNQAVKLVGTSDARLAALTVVCNTILNLDEVICK
ncbi:MAG: DUF1553 domain-containing protein [Planctomycetota bacterium]